MNIEYILVCSLVESFYLLLVTFSSSSSSSSTSCLCARISLRIAHTHAHAFGMHVCTVLYTVQCISTGETNNNLALDTFQLFGELF